MIYLRMRLTCNTRASISLAKRIVYSNIFPRSHEVLQPQLDLASSMTFQLYWTYALSSRTVSMNWFVHIENKFSKQQKVVYMRSVEFLTVMSGF